MTIVNPEYHTLPLPSGPVEALERIKASFLAGELQEQGECKYTSDGMPCAIGSLFSPALRKHLEKDGFNGQRIESKGVVAMIGQQVIETLTGMRLDQCVQVQLLFDRTKDSTGFARDLDQMIFDIKSAALLP